MYAKQTIRENPLACRQDAARLFQGLTEPLLPFYSSGKALLTLGDSAFHYSDRASQMEGFSRVMWGLAPFSAGGFSGPLQELYRQGIRTGTDPDSEEYWGECADGDQRFVEMASLSLALMIAPDTFWEPLSRTEKHRLHLWLDQINGRTIPENNWLFFRVLVNLALEQTGFPIDQAAQQRTLERIDTFYRGDGWYLDGDTGSFDLYNPFGFHFYGLLYAKLNEKNDPIRCAEYRRRARLFAQQYRNWFSDEGACAPFGRSLCYRFAQSCFFSALAFAREEAVEWGACRRIVLQNLRYWMRQPIFDRDGILSIGYAYPNQLMAEDYNAPGSPYWAFKTFLILALPDEHPFWTAREQPVRPAGVQLQKTPGFLVCGIPEDDQVVLLSGREKRWLDNGYFFSNLLWKYGKFAYSSRYGFSVPRGAYSAKSGAFDNTLALCRVGEEGHFRCKDSQTLLACTQQYLCSRWTPWPDVQITTWLIPAGLWHIRIHRILTSVPLHTLEGGFCIRKSEAPSQSRCRIMENGIVLQNETSYSAVYDLGAARQPQQVYPEAGTNIMFAKTEMPVLQGEVPAGENWLACAVMAARISEYSDKETQALFDFQVADGIMEVKKDKELLLRIPVLAQ